MDISIKRIYQKPSESDGTRILIDRIWPRGIGKEEAQLDDWLKEIAPSIELRKWFNHEEDRFLEFSNKYKKELEGRKDIVHDLLSRTKKGRITLLYGAQDETHNQAVVLKNFLYEQQSS